MKKLIFIALIAAGFWHWKGGSFSGSDASVDSAGNPTVIAFTFAECGEPCTDTIAALKHRGVPYEEIEINPAKPDEENYKLWEKYGVRTFPLVVAGKEKVSSSSKSALVALLAINFKDDYLTNAEAQYFTRHFDSNGKPKVVLYGTDWCPTCAELRKEMHAEGMDFVDIDVEKVVDSEQLLKTMEIPGYPAIWVGYRRVNGYTLNNIKAIM